MVAGKICNEPITSGEDKGQAILACLDLTSVSPDTQVGRTSAPTGADSGKDGESGPIGLDSKLCTKWRKDSKPPDQLVGTKQRMKVAPTGATPE